MKGKTDKPRVLVLGGTGRVGGSTAIALSKLCPALHILVAGRNREKGTALVSTLGTFKLKLQFTEDYPNMSPRMRFVSQMFHPNSVV